LKTTIKVFAVLLYLFLCNQVYAVCNVTATSVNFGAYDVFVTAPDDSTGTITILCDRNTNPVRTSISASPNSGGFNPRQMRRISGAGLRLNYNLFTNAARTTIWGDGTSGTSTVSSNARRNRPVTLTIYGRIPAGQDVVIGLYNETLVVTIAY
jgi:spore coat protein U-like protein